MIKYNIFTLTSLLSLVWLSALGSKLNVPSALLPLFSNFPTNFTLEVTEGGCYTWTTLRPNAIRVDCVDAEDESACCSRVVVTSGIKEPRRYTETVLAEDVHTGLVLRCDVILDVINRLQIVTTRREIFLDDPPEVFEVRAYDDQGNEFSTLDGVEFDWSFRTVGPGNKTAESTVIRFITFAESPYETPAAIEPLERIGLKGHVVLLESRETGAATVSVRLPHGEYKDVSEVGVKLLVLTNLIVIPAEATILQGDDLKYRLQRLQQGRVINIAFPSAQYHLTSEDQSVEVDGDSGVARGLALGRAKIVLVDGNVGAASDVKPPTASLMVSSPHDISLAVLPHRKWSVVVGQEYDIVAELRDADRHLFHLGSSASLDIKLDESYFQVDFRTKNGSMLHGTPLKTGKAKVIGELLGVYDGTGQLSKMGHLTATAELHIYEPIRVQPALVLIPWDPITRAKYEIPLKATGGDGSYTWSSARSAVAVVTQRGLVKTLEHGTTTVTVAMTSNPSIRAVSRVRVLSPMALEILNTPLEAYVGISIPVYVVLYADADGVRVPFSACHTLPFTVHLSEANFVKVSTEAATKSDHCAIINVVSNSPGASHVTISYGELSASTVVVVHPPLIPVSPHTGTTVLTVGASRQIAFKGGARSWALKPSENSHNLQNSDKDGENLRIEEQINRSQGESKYVYTYFVTCLQLSETVLTIQILNRPLAPNSTQTIDTSLIRVICGRPKRLILSALNKPPKSCPVIEETLALNNDDFELEMVLKDAHDRQFDNFTTLEVVWKFSKQLVKPVYKRPVIVMGERIGFDFPATHKQKLSSLGKVGVVEVQAHIIGYDQEALFAENVVAEHPPFPEKTASGGRETPDIRATLTINLVDAFKLSTDSTEIFHGGDDAREVEISDGSGHFGVTRSNDHVIFTLKRRLIVVKAQYLGSAVLTVSDLCLETGDALLNVQIYRIGSIKLDVLEYIEQGQSTWASVNLYDEYGMRLTASPSPTALALQPVLTSDIIAVEQDTELVPVGPGFMVAGIAVGITSLSAIAGGVTSPIVPVVVFSPLRIHPRNVTLVAGASVQMTALDGPPGGLIEWSIDEPATALVDVDGVVNGARIGGCTLTARAVVIRKSDGQRVVASQDSVEVQVVPLKKVRIHAPIMELVAGARMPMWAAAPDTHAPLSLSASPPVRFIWSLSHDTLAEIRSIWHPVGLLVPDTDMATVQLFAKKPGQIVISLTVKIAGSVAGVSNAVEYTDSVTIQILSDVSLSSPRAMTLEHLLLSTLATTELRATRDVRDFRVTVLRGGPDVVRVSSDGTLTTGNKTGSAVVAFGPVERPWRHLIVYVKNVEYVLANVIPRWRLKDSRTDVLPNGLDLEIIVSFHDSEGNQFDAVRSNVQVESNQKNLVSFVRGAENKTITVNILDSGSTTIRIWDSRPSHHPADYLHLRSGDVLFPAHARISQGDVVCFQMPVGTGDDSVWALDQPYVLRLWSNVGVGVALEPGTAIVTHRASPRLRSRIDIRPLTKIDLLPHNSVLTTSPDRPVDYPILLSASGERNKKTNLVAINGSCGGSLPNDFTPDYLPFMCRINFNNPAAAIEISQLFEATAVFNLETGIYSCRLKMIGKPSTVSATLTESVVLTAVSRDGSVKSRSALLPLSPSFYVQQTELKVTRAKPSAAFLVSGLRNVLSEIKVVSDKHLVTVSSTASSDTSATYVVNVDPAWWSLDEPPPLTVVVWSPTTQQKTQMRVRCAGLRFDGEPSGSWLPWLTAFAAILMTLFVLASRTISARGPVMTTASPFRQSPQPADVTMGSHIHSTHSHGSPEHSRSPTRRPLNDYPVYGSPWRKRVD